MGKFLTVKRIIIGLAVFLFLIVGVMFGSLFFLNSNMNKEAQRTAEMETGSSFSASVNETEDLPDRVAKLTELVTDLSQKVEQNAELKVAVKQDSNPSLSPQQQLEIENMTKSLQEQLGQANNTVQIQAARLERLERVQKTMVEGGVNGMGGMAESAPRKDGVKLMDDGVGYYGGGLVGANLISTPSIPSGSEAQPASAEEGYYIPSGTMVNVTLLGSVLAPAGGLAQITGAGAPAYPFRVRIDDDVVLADGSEIPLSNEGIIMLDAIGDATNERVMPRMRSVRFFDGEKYYEGKALNIAVFDNIDTQPGLYGVVDDSKRGAEIAKAAAAQLGKTLTDVLIAQQTTIGGINPLTGAQTPPSLSAAGYAGAGAGIDMFIQFFMNKAQTYFDVIKVSKDVMVERNGEIFRVPHTAQLVFNESVFLRPSSDYLKSSNYKTAKADY